MDEMPIEVGDLNPTREVEETRGSRLYLVDVRNYNTMSRSGGHSAAPWLSTCNLWLCSGGHCYGAHRLTCAHQRCSWWWWRLASSAPMPFATGASLLLPFEWDVLTAGDKRLICNHLVVKYLQATHTMST